MKMWDKCLLGLLSSDFRMPKYSIGRYIFDKVSINLENAKPLHIIAYNNSPQNKYLESMKINEPTNWRFIYDDIKNRGGFSLWNECGSLINFIENKKSAI